MGQEAQSSISYISIIIDQQDEENPEETTEGDKKKRKRKRKRKDKTQVPAMPNMENPGQSIYMRTVMITFVFWGNENDKICF